MARAGGGGRRAGQSAAGRFAGRVARRRRSARLTADLDDRDPDYIRENLPLSWLLDHLWFRGEVRNLGNVPEEGPVLLVGNHSGGNVTPDTLSVHARLLHLLRGRAAPSTSSPTTSCSPPRSASSCAATAPWPPRREHAQQALDAGAALLVYPGGDWEVHRPTWERHKVDFAGRKGFIRLALDADVPIVPVVSIGGQETALFLSRGAGSREPSGSTGTLRLKVMPISLALPWGSTSATCSATSRCRRRSRSRSCPRSTCASSSATTPTSTRSTTTSPPLMQETLDTLAAERRFPVIG